MYTHISNVIKRIYVLIQCSVPKYLSPKSPKPGAKNLTSYKRRGSIYVVIIFISGQSFYNFFNPTSQPTMLRNKIFLSSTPYYLSTLTAIEALPPVPSIGSTNKI